MGGFLKILAGLGMIASFGGAVVASVFSLAAAANSTPAQMRGVYLAIGAAISLRSYTRQGSSSKYSTSRGAV